ncbi:MAG: methylmalonyl-CoA epimerase [candidate division Zixibacteria bacterium]|nr:methylmalonyl-CoA epimerase [candidate division Zixibacteria bacterium]MCI0595491.1 methylmalonyl-CoA epimerase [candidate division Zixibacteria bacterium]
MNYKIDHIGIAVQNLSETVAFYLKTFGGRASEVYESKTDKVRVQFVYYDRQRLEFLEPTAPESPIAKFLAAKGPGLHHFCFGVQNIVTELARLKSEGFRLIDEAPRIGAEGKKIAFLHPKSSGGVLIELKETA